MSLDPTPQGSTLTFRSKCDWWLLGLLLFVISAQLTAAVFVFIAGDNERWVGFLLLFSAGFIGWLLRATYYVVDDTRLLVRSGPFWWTVPLETIQEVFPTRNPLSSPALSLDRLCVRYQRGKSKGMIMISPADKEGFLKVVAALVPGMVMDGDAVRRTSPTTAA
jgi:hypothetical protein